VNGLLSKAGWVPAAAFLLLLVLPLYALTAIVVLRSDILSFNGSFTEEQFKAMWTFIASGLATCATVLAALLTKSHQDRSLALQAEVDKRQQLLDDETNWRLNLETTLGGLKVMTTEGAPSMAVAAGGLATIVHMGHPLIALRVLATALDNEKVDPQTAAWVLGEGLLAADDAVKEEAAALLNEHSAEFTENEKPGFFSWPNCLTTAWISDLSRSAGQNVVSGLVELLVSQSQTWWTVEWSWVIYTLDEAMQRDRLADTRHVAATAVEAILAYWEDDQVWGLLDSRSASDVRDRAHALTEQYGQAYVDLESIRRWGDDPNWSKPRSSTPVPPLGS
jgi:hypothetical protein